MDGLWEVVYMFNVIFNRTKRVFILGAFIVVAAWLIWCGEIYDDRHHSALPAIMCAVTSVVLVITGAAIAGRKAEAKWDEMI